MNYKDVIRQMEHRGNYGEADEYRRSLEQHGIQDYERVNPFDVADGAAHTYAGDKAEEAFRDLRRQERYEEERRQEQAEQERQEYERQLDLSRQRTEEEACWEHVNQQEQDAAEREQEQQS